MTEHRTSQINKLMSKFLFPILLCVGIFVWSYDMFSLDLTKYESSINDVLFARESISAIIFKMVWWNQSPLYYILLHFWQMIGHSPGVIRSLNLLLTLLATLFVYFTAKKLSKKPMVWYGAVSFMIISPASLWIVRDGRMYGLFSLLTIGCLYSIICYFKSDKKSDLIAFLTLMALGIYNHFFGFWVSFLIGLWIISIRIYENKIKHRVECIDRQKLSTLLLSSIPLLLIVLPQVVRFIQLLLSPRTPDEAYSLSSSMGKSLWELVWFYFINTDLEFGMQNTLVGILGIGTLYLVILGIMKVRYDLKILGIIFIGSVFFLLMQSSHMDLRARYFFYAFPLFCIFMAIGAFERFPSERKFHLEKYVSPLIAAIIVILLVIPLSSKLTDKPPRWHDLLTELEKKHRPGTTYYIGNAPNLLHYTIDLYGFNDEMKKVIIPGQDERIRFIDAVKAGQDFVFIQWWLGDNPTTRWMRGYLKKHEYKVTKIDVGLRARHYQATQPTTNKEWSTTQKVSFPGLKEDAVIEWLLDNVDQNNQTSIYPDQVLKNAVVARVFESHVKRAKTYIHYGPGEGGVWKLGDGLWNIVETKKVEENDGTALRVWAHPEEKSVLAIVFPGVLLSERISIMHGFFKSISEGLHSEPTFLSVFMGTQKIGKLTSHRKPGWEQSRFKLDLNQERETLIFLIQSQNQKQQHYGFSFSSDSNVKKSNTIDLISKRLSEQIENMDVYQTTEQSKKILPISFDPTRLDAEEVHEKHGKKTKTGWVKNRWILSYKEWDMVGQTRQKSDQEPRDGIWAHPKNNTTLHMVLPHVKTGEHLIGYGGFTDHSRRKSRRGNRLEPTLFTIFDGEREIYHQAFQKEKGWKNFKVPINSNKGDISIQIKSENDKWSHFIFDLWSDDESNAK